MDTGIKRLWENNIVQNPRWLFKTVQRSGFAGWKAFAEERVLSGADDLAASGKDCESQTENGKNFV